MGTLSLDMIQTAGMGALALIVGMFLTRKVSFLQKYCRSIFFPGAKSAAYSLSRYHCPGLK